MEIVDIVDKKITLQEFIDLFPQTLIDKLLLVDNGEVNISGEKLYSLKFVNSVPVCTKSVNNRGQKVASGEIVGVVTNQIVIPAPGVGKRILIKYSALRTLAVSGHITGQTWFSDDENTIYGKFSFERGSSLASPYFELPILLPENSSYKVTVSGNGLPCFYFIQYLIEEV